MSTNKTKTSGVDVEKLLAKKDQVNNSVIQSALKRLEAEKAAQLEDQLLQHIEKTQSNTSKAVENLRHARAQEKSAKGYLQAVANAEDEFLQDANINKYNQAVTVARHTYAVYL